MVFTFPVSRYLPVGGLSEPLIHLIDLMFKVWVVWLRVYVVISVHIWFIVHIWFCRFFAGVFMGFDD
jgi:hypothetical protein